MYIPQSTMKNLLKHYAAHPEKAGIAINIIGLAGSGKPDLITGLPNVKLANCMIGDVNQRINPGYILVLQDLGGATPETVRKLADMMIDRTKNYLIVFLCNFEHEIGIFNTWLINKMSHFHLK